MEVFAELLIRIVVELFGELILTAMIKLIGLFYKRVDTDNFFRRRLKFVLTYIFIGLIMILLINSIIHSTRYLVILSLSYMIFQIVLTLLGIINKDRQSHPLMKFTNILKKVSHYVYPILLIIFSTVYMKDTRILTLIITLSSITLTVLSAIDLYRFSKRKNNLK